MNDAGSTQHQDSTMRITTHGLAGSQGRDGAPVPVSVLCWREACAEDTHTPNRTSSGGCVPYGLGGATAPRADHAFVALTTYMGSPCEMRALRALSKLRRVPMKPPPVAAALVGALAGSFWVLTSRQPPEGAYMK